MKRGYADTPEGQIHYYEEGTGEPLLLLHQTGSSRSLFGLIPFLSKNYRVFAVDNLGEGNSDALPPDAEIRDMARSYIHFMDALRLEKAHVFGIHTGNKTGTELGAGWPERIAGLILCGQTHSMQANHKDQVSVMGAKDRPMLRQFEPSPDASHLIKEWATQFNYLTTMWWGTDVSTMQKITPELLQRRKNRVLDLLQARGTKEKYRAIFAFDLGGRMRDIKVKQTLVIELRVPEEAHLPPQGEKLLQLIPNSRLITLECEGNLRVVETNAEQLADAILGYLNLNEVRMAKNASR